MSASVSPFLETLRWYASAAGFPASRLNSRAECLLLIAMAARADESVAAPVNGGALARRDVAKDSALRAHAMRRSLVHLRCDNSAKV